METGSIKNKKYSEVTLAVIISVMMLSPVLSFADIVSLPIPQGFSISSPFSEDLGKPLGSPKIINTHSKTTRTYSKDFWSIGSKGPSNIQNKIIWKVNKDKIVDVYTNQRRMGCFIIPLGIIKDNSKSDEQKWAMIVRQKFVLASEKNFGIFRFGNIVEHRITIFRDGRSYLKLNVHKRS